MQLCVSSTAKHTAFDLDHLKEICHYLDVWPIAILLKSSKAVLSRCHILFYHNKEYFLPYAISNRPHDKTQDLY